MSTLLDLTTLNLPTGTHSITVRAKGTHWLDSDSSESVSYDSIHSLFITIEGDIVSFPAIPEETAYYILYVNDRFAKKSVENSFDLSVILADAKAGDYAITVTAVENSIESEPSNVVLYNRVIEGTGIGTIDYQQKEAWSSYPITRKFEVGMTWVEFVVSDYNCIQDDRYFNDEMVIRGQFIIEGDSVKFDGYVYELATSKINNEYTINVYNVSPNQLIISNYEYYSKNPSSGGSN